ncbi:histidine kinase dimerization/phosphoacceptor domain -containing protein [Frateuria sp. GZRR33]|uniref:histidine kinase dimerization/phosphoacceptor domain -containing protein n=1 Tax=Frateuria sp. GZRR33 TaxID=3351535 RepID=UPI003EDC3E09
MGFSPDVHHASGCEPEPFHLPAAIQPHGALLSLDGRGVVTQLAGDTCRAIGLVPEDLLGKPIDALVDSKGRALALLMEELDPPMPGYVAQWHPQPPGAGAWEITVHPKSKGAIIEFEPAAMPPAESAQSISELARAIASLELPKEADALFGTMAAEVRRLTGYDRVLVYRLLDDEAGEVVGEARADALPSLLNHRFPGCGAPGQARAFYLRNQVRIIPDAHYVPAPLRTAGSANAEPLDMSDCSLRSVSPIHLQWLRAMGVASSMSIPIEVDNQPWGLVACHHSAPRHMAYEVREACRQLGREFSHQIQAREKARHRRQSSSLRALRTAWLGDLRVALDADRPLELDLARVAGMVPCNGVALVSPGRVELHGQTPDPAETAALAAWLAQSLHRKVFATHHLAGELAAAAPYATQASGVLATAVGESDPTLLLWFRAEEITRVTWAGTPHDGCDSDGESRPAALCPRSSFDSWQQTVHQTARRWSRAEINAARQLGRSLAALFQQQVLRRLNDRLRDTLAQQQSLVAEKNVLMQEVHHRVQNSLQIVNSMLQLQARQTSDREVRNQFEGAVNRLMAVSAVHRHLWRSSDAQNVRLGPYLRELCADLMFSWGDGWSGRVAVEATDTAIPSQTAVTLALLVTELLTNAAKYAYAGAPGPVEVRADRTGDGGLRVMVRDHGLGMHGPVKGGGLGSKLIRIFTAQLGGHLETSTAENGTTVTITVPTDSRIARPLAVTPPKTPA